MHANDEKHEWKNKHKIILVDIGVEGGKLKLTGCKYNCNVLCCSVNANDVFEKRQLQYKNYFGHIKITLVIGNVYRARRLNNHGVCVCV